MNKVGFEEIDMVIGELNQPIDCVGDMLRHEVEWTRNFHTEPCDYVATLIAKNGKLPEIVGG